jgi:DNA repair exonuclease SbcCD ATPase subunit
MIEASPRASVTSQVHTANNWDAGVHAECPIGAIDIGLAVEPASLGMMIVAPGIGSLSLGFDLTPDGSTALATFSRTFPDGTAGQTLQPQDALVHSLERRLLSLGEELAEARNVFALQSAQGLAETETLRSALQSQDQQRRELAKKCDDLRQNLSEQRAALEHQLLAAATGLKVEKDARLLCLAEREKIRAELDRLQSELDAGSATLMREVNEARAARNACEIERSKISSEFSELSGEYEQRGTRLEELTRENARLSAELTSAKSVHRAVGESGETNDRQARDEARAIARQLKVQLDRMILERDEARALARTLHQQLTAAVRLP